MSQVEVSRSGSTTQYTLDGQTLSNDDALEIRLGGNRGWMDVTVTGLPGALRIVFMNDDQQRLVTSVPPEAQLRWR